MKRLIKLFFLLYHLVNLVCFAAEEQDLILTKEQIEKNGIKTGRAGPGRIQTSLMTRGKIIVHPDRLVHILPKVSGLANETHKNIGDNVNKGEVLATIESREIADIKANYLASLEKAKLSQSHYEREKRLYEKKISAEQDFLKAQSELAESKLQIQLDKQKLYALGFNDEEIDELTAQKDPDLRIYEIRAPLDGTIIGRHITKGEYIENTKTIYEIVDLTKVWIEIGVYPKDLSKIHKNQKVEVLAPFDNQKNIAKIIYISPLIKDETIAATAIAEMDNQNEVWRPGTFVKVKIDLGSIEADIVVPKSAVQEVRGKKVVFIRTSQGFKKTKVELGESDDQNVQILSGLNKGQVYAFNQTFLLKADLEKGSAEEAHE